MFFCDCLPAAAGHPRGTPTQIGESRQDRSVCPEIDTVAPHRLAAVAGDACCFGRHSDPPRGRNAHGNGGSALDPLTRHLRCYTFTT